MDKEVAKRALPYIFALAVVLIIAFFVFSKMYFNAQKDLVSSAGEALDGLFDVVVEVEHIVYNEIESCKQEAKIVVMSAEVTVTHRISSRINRPWWPDSYSFAEATFYNNRVQYVISTEALSMSDFSLDKKNNILYISIPKPHIDMDIVEVQHNPNMIEMNSDGNIFHPADVEFLETSLLALIRADVLVAGNVEILLRQASINAEEVIQQMYQPLFARAGLNIQVVVMVEDNFQYPGNVEQSELHHF